MKKWYLKIVESFRNWLQPAYMHFFVDDIPENVGSRTIYIVGNKEQPWLIAFKCPCGCNNLIQLNLLKEASPLWGYKVTNKNKINVSPSVWRSSGCKSHFHVQKSKINWVKVQNHSI